MAVCGWGMTRRQVTPAGMVDPDGDLGVPYSQGTLVDGTLFVSGQTATGADGEVSPRGDLEGQFRRALENVERVVEAAGGSMGDVVECVIYVTDMAAWRSGDASDVRREFFEAPFPSSTLVEVGALARPGMLVEVKATAVLD